MGQQVDGPLAHYAEDTERGANQKIGRCSQDCTEKEMRPYLISGRISEEQNYRNLRLLWTLRDLREL
jgi:hypothetical protein